MKKDFKKIIVIFILLVISYFTYSYFVRPTSLFPSPTTTNTPNPTAQPTRQVSIKDNSLFKKNNPHVGDILVNNLTTNQEEQITSYGYNSKPSLSPDETWIAYLSWPKTDISKQAKAVEDGYGGSLTNNIWIIRPDGTGAQQVIKDLGTESAVSWSPNSRYFVTLTIGYQVFDIQQMKVVATINDNDPASENAQSPTWLDGHRFVYAKQKTNSLDSAPAVYDIELKTSTWQ